VTRILNAIKLDFRLTKVHHFNGVSEISLEVFYSQFRTKKENSETLGLL